MNNRDVVKTALQGHPPPYVPWSFRFTEEAKKRLGDQFGGGDIEPHLDNHILELGSDIGFFEDLGNDLYRDVFGVVWDRSLEKDIGDVRGIVLPEPHLDSYTFPDPLDPRFFEDIPDKLAAYGDRYRLYCLGFSLFERAWTLRGFDNLLMDMVLHPEFVHNLVQTIADYNIAQIKKALSYEIDAVYFGDDWGQQRGLLMGYPHWKTFIRPALERMYVVVKEAGKAVFIHSCGDVQILFDDLVNIGVDCFNPFQPEVMDIRTLFARYKGRLSFWGGLSVQQTLPFGSPEQVREETRELLELGRQGNYILSPSHAVGRDTPLENMLAFIETVRDQPGYRDLR